MYNQKCFTLKPKLDCTNFNFRELFNPYIFLNKMPNRKLLMTTEEDFQSDRNVEVILGDSAIQLFCEKNPQFNYKPEIQPSITVEKSPRNNPLSNYEVIEDYESKYTGESAQPKERINGSIITEDKCSAQPGYDMDSDDEEFLENSIYVKTSPYQFEQLIDTFETGSSGNSLFKFDCKSKTLKQINTYWENKRARRSGSMLFKIATENSSQVKSTDDDYIAFREWKGGSTCTRSSRQSVSIGRYEIKRIDKDYLVQENEMEHSMMSSDDNDDLVMVTDSE